MCLRVAGGNLCCYFRAPLQREAELHPNQALSRVTPDTESRKRYTRGMFAKKPANFLHTGMLCCGRQERAGECAWVCARVSSVCVCVCVCVVVTCVQCIRAVCACDSVLVFVYACV